jgi:hypothetical protein
VGIGIEPPVRQPGPDVRVEVDEAGRDQQPGAIDHLAGLMVRQGGRNRADPSVAEADVEPATRTTGIDDLATGQEQVEAHVRRRCGRRR